MCIVFINKICDSWTKMFAKQVFLYDRNLSDELFILSYVNINFICVIGKLYATRYPIMY